MPIEEHDLENDRAALTDDIGAPDGESVILDSHYLASQTFGDIELEVELLELFVAQARRLVAELLTQDAGDRGDTLHLLKGSARAVGAGTLAGAVESFEVADRGHGFDDPAYRAMVAAFQQTEAAIAVRLSDLQA